jgi:hypothetical protein
MHTNIKVIQRGYILGSRAVIYSPQVPNGSGSLLVLHRKMVCASLYLASALNSGDLTRLVTARIMQRGSREVLTSQVTFGSLRL